MQVYSSLIFLFILSCNCLFIVRGGGTQRKWFTSQKCPTVWGILQPLEGQDFPWKRKYFNVKYSSTKMSITKYSSTEMSNTKYFSTEMSITKYFSTEMSITKYFSTDMSITKYFSTEMSNVLGDIATFGRPGVPV